MNLFYFLIFSALYIDSLFAYQCRELNRTVIHIELDRHQAVRLGECTQNEVQTRNISHAVSYIVFQVHSQQHSLNVSLTSTYQHDTSVSGSDRGVLTLLKRQQDHVSWFVNSTLDVTVSMMAITYTKEDPVAGGCSLEFNLVRDPNIHVTYTTYATTISFQLSDVGYTRDLVRGIPACQGFTQYLQYEIYQYFVGDHDLSEGGYSTSVRHMSTWRDVEQYGDKVLTFKSNKKMTKVKFNSYAGQGAVYNVLVVQTMNNKTTKAAYIPVTSYACDLTNINSCHKGIYSIVLCIGVGMAGLFLCFCGHRFFKTEVFLFGFLPFTLAGFIVLAVGTTWTLTVCGVVAAVTGLLGGLVWLALWWRKGLPVISVLLIGLTLGYLISAVAFYTPLGRLEYWQSNINYGLTFTCCTLFVPAVLLYFTKTLSIISCSIIGSYGVTVALSTLIGASLSHIVTNPIKRAIVLDFGHSVMTEPFYTKDIVLCAIWYTLTTLGVFCQFYLSKGKPDFPPCPYKEWKERRYRTHIGTERERLINNDATQAPPEGPINSLPAGRRKRENTIT